MIIGHLSAALLHAWVYRDGLFRVLRGQEKQLLDLKISCQVNRVMIKITLGMKGLCKSLIL